jgi:hypothetical protein
MFSITAENAKTITVTAEVAADLAGKEGHVVEQVAGKRTVQLYTNGIPYAVLGERIQGSDQWSAYPINGGGIVPCVAGGVINTPAYVKPQNGGKVVAAASGNLAIGTKREPLNAAADNDVVAVDLGLVTMP